MKVFTNKYPVLGMLTMKSDGTFDKNSINIEFCEGKVFKIIGISFDDIVLECEGRVVSVKSTVFSISFTETVLDI